MNTKKWRAQIDVWRHGPTKVWERVVRDLDDHTAKQLLGIGASSKDVDPNEVVHVLGSVKQNVINHDQGLRLLKCFLKAGFDPNQRAHNKNTLLEQLQHHGASLELLKCVVDAGVDLKMCNKYKHTPCEQALLDLLLTYHRDFSDQRAAVIQSQKDVLLYFLSCSAPLDLDKIRDHRMPAMVDFEVFKAIIDSGVSLTWDNWMGHEKSSFIPKVFQKTIPQKQTVLFALSEELFHPDFEQCLQYLLHFKQDHNTKNEYGNFLFHCVHEHPTPSSLPLRHIQTDLQHAFKVFQNNQYAFDAINDQGETLWHVLFKNANERSVVWFDALIKTQAILVMHHLDNQGRSALDVLNATLKDDPQFIHCKSFIERDLLQHSLPAKTARPKRKV